MQTTKDQKKNINAIQGVPKEAKNQRRSEQLESKKDHKDGESSEYSSEEVSATPTSKMAASCTSRYDEAKNTVDDNQDGLETTESAKSCIEALSKKTVQHILASIFEGCMVDRELKPLENSRQD